MTAACGLPWLRWMERPGSLAVLSSVQMLAYFWLLFFFFSFCFNYNSSSVCLCECAGLPLLSGKHYRVFLENLSKPAQSSSTFKGSSLVSYCQCKHTEKVALYHIYPSGVIYFAVIIFFHTWAAPETPSLPQFPQISTYRDSTEGHPFPVWISFFLDLIILFFPFHLSTFLRRMLFISALTAQRRYRSVTLAHVCAHVSFCL